MPVGHLTREDLIAVWRASVDPEYARSILEAGDGEGAEVVGQLAEMLAAVSLGAEETSQELYLLESSGQSSDPAGGAERATAALTAARARRAGELLVLEPGALVEEVQVDAGPDGGVEVATGRRFALDARLALFPGDAGPVDVASTAEKPGRGYRWPAAGSLRRLVRPGAGLGNDSATVEPSTGAQPHRLRAAPKPDAPVPDHVGQTVEFLAGANAGRRSRVVGYEAPTFDDGGGAVDAGSLLLGRDALLAVSSVSGTFLVGETVRTPGGGTGVLLAVSAAYALVERTNDVATATGSLAGDLSGATATIGAVEQSEDLAAEDGDATWRVIDPAERYGLSFTNAAPPTGGRDAVLDSHAWERSRQRAAGEDDAALRARIAEPGDAISPLAVLRAANRALAPYGSEAALREAGGLALPGFYLDVDALDYDAQDVSGAVSGAFNAGEPVSQEDTLAFGTALTAAPAGAPGDVLGAEALVAVVRVTGGPFASGSALHGVDSGASVAAPVFGPGLREGDRYRWFFDYAEMRAFMLVGVGHRGVGDFGFAWDEGPYAFFDSSPALTFYDGFAATSAAVALRVWQAVDEVRGGGVGHDLVQETGAI